jgi:hypothetical protein
LGLRVDNLHRAVIEIEAMSVGNSIQVQLTAHYTAFATIAERWWERERKAIVANSQQ